MDDPRTKAQNDGSLDALLIRTSENVQCEFGGDDDPFAHTTIYREYVYAGGKLSDVPDDKMLCYHITGNIVYSNNWVGTHTDSDDRHIKLNGEEIVIDRMGIHQRDNNATLSWKRNNTLLSWKSDYGVTIKRVPYIVIKELLK